MTEKLQLFWMWDYKIPRRRNGIITLKPERNLKCTNIRVNANEMSCSRSDSQVDGKSCNGRRRKTRRVLWGHWSPQGTIAGSSLHGIDKYPYQNDPLGSGLWGTAILGSCFETGTFWSLKGWCVSLRCLQNLMTKEMVVKSQGFTVQCLRAQWIRV